MDDGTGPERPEPGSPEWTAARIAFWREQQAEARYQRRSAEQAAYRRRMDDRLSYWRELKREMRIQAAQQLHWRKR